MEQRVRAAAVPRANLQDPIRLPRADEPHERRRLEGGVGEILRDQPPSEAHGQGVTKPRLFEGDDLLVTVSPRVLPEHPDCHDVQPALVPRPRHVVPTPARQPLGHDRGSGNREARRVRAQELGLLVRGEPFQAPAPVEVAKRLLPLDACDAVLIRERLVLTDHPLPEARRRPGRFLTCHELAGLERAHRGDRRRAAAPAADCAAD